jgi:putative transposase
MPRKARVEIPGYYHIINRGVDKRNIFLKDEDFHYFLDLLYKESKNYNIILHNYCLMSNHYHLFIQLHSKNLSKFMRQINSQYAIYFNKTYKRTGHLWQGRFKSQIVPNEAYFYILIRYIEQNPLNAKIVKNIEEYEYSSAHHFLKQDCIECLKESWIKQTYQNDFKSIKEFLNEPIGSDELQELKKASSLIEAPSVSRELDEKVLSKRLSKAKDTNQRNEYILQAYQDGYSQHKIANTLKLNQATVQRIIKRTKESNSISIT